MLKKSLIMGACLWINVSHSMKEEAAPLAPSKLSFLLNQLDTLAQQVLKEPSLAELSRVFDSSLSADQTTQLKKMYDDRTFLAKSVLLFCTAFKSISSGKDNTSTLVAPAVTSAPQASKAASKDEKDTQDEKPFPFMEPWFE